MSTTLIDRVTGPVLQVVKHPLRLASFGVGLARGVVGAVIRVAGGAGGPAHAEWVAPAKPLVDEALVGEAVQGRAFGQQEFPPAAPQRAPAEPGESFVTEPSAVSRASAHGGGGADAEIDDWYGETLDDDGEPVGVVAALEFGDRFAEPADVKAILSEAETLRRAAQLPRER